MKGLATLMLVVSLLFGARGGYLFVPSTLYYVFGTRGEARVTESAAYQVRLRKLRPARMANRYRGTYEFTAGDSRTPVSGRFDTAGFLTAGERVVSLGDTLPVRYCRFAPSWSVPADATRLLHVLLAGFVVMLSLGGLAFSYFLFQLASPAAPGR